MHKRKTLGHMVSSLAISFDKTQAELAEQAGVTVSQLNRFLNGHSNLNLDNFVSLLKILDIDLFKIVKDKQASISMEFSEEKIETDIDCLLFLYKSLDSYGRQTVLNNVAWAAKVANKKELPRKLEEVLNRETNLI